MGLFFKWLVMNNWILRNTADGETLQLHQQFHFKNRYDWQQMAQSETQRTLSGGIVIQRSLKLNGREIELNGENAQVKREVLEKLQEWATQNLKFSLESPTGEKINVIFAPKGWEIIKERIIREDDQSQEDVFRINLFFITV